ncbi:MAG: hypothetical protein LBG24_06570 [Treponema sp.]|jgi:hypothetical protein|nr:hypothetical protein [Treponema sp.]
MARDELVNSIKEYIKAEPRHFSDVVEAYRQYPYREVLYAWSDIRGAGLFDRDREGHYLIKEE